MGLEDVVLRLVLTCAGFFAGFCARGIFGLARDDEWPMAGASGQYEPPRRNERL